MTANKFAPHMMHAAIQAQTTEMRQYYDTDNNPITLSNLVRKEPEWAANQIRHRDFLMIEVERQTARAEYLIKQLIKIYELLPPPDIKTEDGKTMRFMDPNLDSTHRELCSRIKQIPDILNGVTVAAALATERKEEV